MGVSGSANESQCWLGVGVGGFGGGLQKGQMATTLITSSFAAPLGNCIQRVRLCNAHMLYALSALHTYIFDLHFRNSYCGAVSKYSLKIASSLLLKCADGDKFCNGGRW